MFGRRRFLLGIGAAVGCVTLGRPLLRRFALSGTDLRGFERKSAALGTEVSITVLHSDKSPAQTALDAAFAELETVEAVMSIYRPSSELRRLNDDGVLDQPHPYLVEVLWHAAATSRLTGGAFDVTVQPLWTLFAESRRRGELPSEALLAKTLELVDWRNVEIQTDRIRLHQPSMQITLNGIAQGFAADRAVAALRSQGVEHALVDTGELAPLGSNKNRPWQAGIQHPHHHDAYVALSELKGRCLATSGEYAVQSVDGRFQHIFDPRSGRSPQEVASVTIAAPTAMAADALSTACFVLGPQQAAEVIERIDGVDALFVLKNDKVLKTTHFPIEA